MNTVLPVAIVVLLGVFFSFALHRFKWPFLVWASAAALLATVAWIVGVYLLLALTGPGELGPPLPRPLFLTFLTALMPALLVCGILRYAGPRVDKSRHSMP